MTVSEIDAIVCETTIAAPPERVFAFFTDPELYARWMGQHAELDPRPGGIYAVHINARARATGTFQEIVPHSRIVFTFGWEGPDQLVPPGSSTVEVTLTPTTEGTHVRLVHRGLREHNQREQHRRGWEHYLSRLSITATGADPGQDPNV